MGRRCPDLDAGTMRGGSSTDRGSRAVECAQCGEVNREGARFCAECGAPASHRCANCAAELRPTAKFCDECGTPTAATPPAAAATTPDATRKTVTALFADLVGSTSFGERADAEVARSVMARYHALLQDAIDAHGGTVAKFMGDGMMATFGIPEIAEDDAIRAVHAGVDIQRRFTEFATDVARQHGEALGLRVGVNTGEVVIASGDADLVGDALNVAARIEHACNPGRVAVGEETWRLTRGEFGYDSLGEVTVAGRAQPVAIYEVVADASATVETTAPFVGRVSEIITLRAALDAALEARAARLVTVLGSPGVGKTRLSRELCAALADDANAATVELRCDRAGDATFAPIAQLIRTLADLSDDADIDADTVRARLGTLLADDEPDRERLIDVFAGLVGTAPSRSVEETFWGIRRLVSATSGGRPTVVVIDDIQWAEPLLLDLLEHLAEWVQDVPLLIVCLARPELRDVRPSLAEPGRRVEAVLALDGLDAAATEALAAGLLGTDRLPPGLVERLPTSTDGNPLFVRELVRMLVDDQVIRRTGDEWELAIDAEAVEVPPTIQSLLAARVERLPGDERSVLELASVIGAEFNLGALRDLAGPTPHLPALLESMRRKELVEPTGTYWGDEPVHRFHHVLIRDAAYRRLLKTTRADLHERVAVWTDRAAEHLIGEHEAVIAFHYEQAHSYRGELGTVDDHVTGLGRRAAELLSVAADRALGRDDLAAAGTLSNRAVALLPESDTAERARLLLVACECTLSSGDVGAARPAVAQLRAEAGEDPTLGAWASCFEAQLVGLTDPDGLVGAEATATGAAKLMEELGDGAGEAKAHQVRAELLARLGRVGDAELELDLALGAARRVDDRRRVTAVLGAAPLAALWGPSPVARAGGRCLDVVRLLRITTASPSVEATSMRCQAVLEALRGRFDVARSMLDASRTTLEELGLRHGLWETAHLTGVVELVAGDASAAITPLREAYDGLIEMGVGIDAGRAAALLAHALVAEGRIDDAEPFAAASEHLAGQDLKTAIAWRVARAEVLAARGEIAAGIALATEAVEIAAATDLVIDHADACASLAALHDQAGDVAAARAARTEAKRLYDLKGATVPSARLTDEPPSAPEPVAAPTHAPRRTVPTPTVSSGGGELGSVAAETRTPDAVNAAVDAVVEIGARLGRWSEIPDRFTPDVTIHDRRRLVGGAHVRGRDEVLASDRALGEVGLDTPIERAALAVRGERLALVVGGTSTVDGLESTFLTLLELAEDGRVAALDLFDEEDVVDALDELAARHLAREGAGSGTGLIAAEQVLSAANRRAWDECLDLYSTDLRHVDHRQIGLPILDREGLVATVREYCELVPGLVLRGRSVIARGDVYLTTSDVSGSTADGSMVEWVQHAVGVLDADGRVSEIEMFDEDDFPAALARFDELASAEPVEARTPHAVNTATRVTCGYCDAWSPDRIDELLREYAAPDIVRVDHRSMVAAPEAIGYEAFTESVRSLAAVGYTSTSFEPIAVRGERLCLGVNSYRNDQGFATAQLALVEIDADGRMVFIGNYDETDLLEALEELEARYRADEGAEHAEMLDFGATVSRAMRRRNGNNDAVRALMAPDFTLVDHRTLGYGEIDLPTLSTLQEGRDEQIASEVKFHRTRELRGTTMLAWYDTTASAPDGGEFSWSHWVIWHVAKGLWTRLEMFDLDDEAAARARFAELSSAAPTSRPPNLANRASQRLAEIVDLAHARDRAASRALLTDDFVRLDRRTGVAAPDAHGPEEWVAALDAWFDVGMERLSIEPLAVRGQQLVLARIALSNAEGAVVPFLGVWETDGSGLFVRAVHFDDAALAEALDELDERYATGEGAEHAYLVRRAQDYVRSLAQLDGEATLALCDPAITFTDHRLLGVGTMGIEGVRSLLATRAQQVTQDVSLFRSLEIRNDAVIGFLDSRDVDEHGVASLYQMLWVARFVAGRIVEHDWYDLDDEAAARARFEELAAEPRTPDIDNACVRALVRGEWLVQAGEIGASIETISDDVVSIDRRQGIAGLRIVGRDDYITNQIEFRLLFQQLDREWIATRGERLAIALATWTSDRGDEVVFYATFELDAAARLCRSDQYSDLDTALAALDVRYVEIAGGELPEVEAELIRGVELLNRRDWDGFAALVHPDFVAVDHSPLGFPTTGRDGFVNDQMRGMTELVPDFVVVLRKILTTARATLVVGTTLGTTVEGSEYRWDFVQVMQASADGRAVRRDLYAEDQWIEALARFDELTTESTEAPIGAGMVARSAARTEALDRGDREAVLATYAPDFVREDRRQGVNFGTAGREETVDALLAGNEVGLGNRTFTPIETAGEHLMLTEARMSHDDGFEIAYLLVLEDDEDGLLRRAANFDLEDHAIASALLHLWASERGDTTESQPENAVTRRLAEYPERFFGRDWESIAEWMAEDIVNDDRRSGVSAGVVSGRDAVLALTQGLEGVGFTAMTNDPIAVRGDRVALFRRVWHHPDGYEVPLLAVMAFDDDGQMTVNVMWDTDQLDAAVAELHRLAVDP